MMNKLKGWWNTANFKALSILLCFCLIVSFLHGQTVIEGQIDHSLGVDSFRITYTTNFVEHDEIFTRGTEIMVNVDDGRFKIELNESPAVFYVKFNLPKNRSDSIGNDYRILGNNANIFMIEPNSTVMINVLPQKVLFSGMSAPLMKCQFDLFSLYARMKKERISLSAAQGHFDHNASKEDVWKFLDAYKAVHDTAIHVAKDIISTYAFDSLTSNAIYYNFYGSVRFFEINYLNLKSAFSKDSLRAYFVGHYNEFYSDEKIPDESKNYLGQSNMYPRYLAYKTRTDISMRLAPLGRRIKPNLMLVDKLISERYRDHVYDQVALSSFLNRGTKEYMDDMFFMTLLGNIKNQEYKEYISEMRNKKSSGRKSYQFELEDEHGKIYRNADFKGKVILLDFWFTGCRGCIALHKNMKPVKERFKRNPDFVYVSVSIDTKKEMWKNSLASGDYTDDTDIKLWLGDLGKKHPIIKYYNIASYPTMIIIDGDDEIVAINPPNPYTEHNENALVNIIEEALNK
ncbi:TlpA family protein disulfide reductase [Sphingobacterium arenae]|uniref:TlpA family protein disulfide reductase n=1 Tax=Sphingobacterium arenae TaxID=1280598 RepID=A0ABR7Y2Y0_9SPHI|nr:TlpA disulfide reductase family protein [Sphingobacterium arenae]MBD1425659.1 TlpA family protein disulfide reductase [Sphingobacterium arenae]